MIINVDRDTSIQINHRNTENCSVNHILVTFTSYRTYIQIIEYLPFNSLYYYRIGVLMFKLSTGLITGVIYESHVKNNKIYHFTNRHLASYSDRY